MKTIFKSLLVAVMSLSWVTAFGQLQQVSDVSAVVQAVEQEGEVTINFTNNADRTELLNTVALVTRGGQTTSRQKGPSIAVPANAAATTSITVSRPASVENEDQVR